MLFCVLDSLPFCSLPLPLPLKGPNMVKGNFPTQFPLKHQQKDVKLACDLGDEVGQALPIAKAVNAKFEEALATAGDQDFSAVLTVTKSK